MPSTTGGVIPARGDGRGPRGGRLLAVTLTGALVLTASTAILSGARREGPGSSEAADPQADTRAAEARAGAAYAQLPIGFEVNAGQTDPSVGFVARGQDYTLFLTPSESVMSLQRRTPEPAAPTTVLGMQLLGADPAATPRATTALPGRANYFVGSDPQQWRTDIPTYGQAAYEGVYPGIDVAYHGTQGRLEYDFIVAPGADPGVIRLGMTGIDALTISPEGDLVLGTPTGDVRQQRPVLFQEVDGGRRPVAGDFVLLGDREVGFRVGQYDASRTLVIDPVLAYSTYEGGTANDFGFGIEVDKHGNAYLGGQTSSSVFPRGGSCVPPGATTCDPGPKGSTPGAVQPAIAGESDGFVLKLNAAGDTVLYSTYLGGSRGDAGWDLAVDPSGIAYLAGSTISHDDPGTTAVEAGFPTTANAYDKTCGTDGKCNDDLPPNFFTDACDPFEPACNPADPASPGYLTAICPPATFPTGCATTGGAADNFLAKLSKTGNQLLYSTLFGGSAAETSPEEVPYSGQMGMDLRRATAYMTSLTYSSDFPTTPTAAQPACASCADGVDDSYLTMIDTAQTGTAGLVYSTYLGGDGFDEGKGVAVDEKGNAYLTGTITGVDSTLGGTTFPVRRPLGGTYLGAGAYDGSSYRGGYSDAYITKINPNEVKSLVFSSFLGGGATDEGWDVGVDRSSKGNPMVYVTGYTASGANPNPQVEDPAHPGACAGGAGTPFCDWASDPAPYFPVTAGAYQTTFAGRATTDSGSTLFLDGDAFVVKLTPDGRSFAASTFVGGPNADYGQGLAIDRAGKAYVTGWTTCRSQDPPGTGGVLDPPPQFDPDGIPNGRNPGEPAQTGVPDCPLTAPTPGGPQPGAFPQVDPLPGRSKMNSTNFDNHINDSPTGAFLTKLAADLGSVDYSILVDGPGFDRGFDVAVRDTDANGNPLAAPQAYITGRTGSAPRGPDPASPDFTFPLTAGAHDITYNGAGRDAFITKIVG